MSDDDFDDLDRYAGIVSRLADQETLAKDLGEKVESQGQDITRLKQLIHDPTVEPRPWIWYPHKFPRALDRSQAQKAWPILTTFVDELIIPIYDGGWRQDEPEVLRQGTSVKTCWFAHPDQVQRLSDLYWAWMGDYRPNASPSGPLDFSITLVGKVLKELKDHSICSSRGCERFHTVVMPIEDRMKASGRQRTVGSSGETKEVLEKQDRDAFITLDIAERRTPRPAND